MDEPKLAQRPAGPVVSDFDTPGGTLLYAGFVVMGLSQGLARASSTGC